MQVSEDEERSSHPPGLACWKEPSGVSVGSPVGQAFVPLGSAISALLVDVDVLVVLLTS